MSLVNAHHCGQRINFASNHQDLRLYINTNGEPNPKNLSGKSRCLIDCTCSTLSHAVESFRGAGIDLQTTESQESLICCLSSRLQAGLGVVSAEVINLDCHSHFVIGYHDYGMCTLLNLGIAL
jgi:hypothetical protein